MGHIDYAILALCGYALVSLLWAPKPAAAAVGIGGVMVVYACTKIMIAAGEQSEPVLRWAALRGFMTGVIVAGILCSLDLALKRVPSVWLLNEIPELTSSFGRRHLAIAAGKIVGISDAGIDRTITVLALCLLPVWLATSQIDHIWSRRSTVALVATIAITILFASTHQTSQAAFIASGVVRIAYKIHKKFGRAVLMTGWATAVFLVVPLSIFALENLKLNESRWLFSSARTRVVIWGQLGRASAKAPILGVGARGSAIFETDTAISGGRSVPKSKKDDGKVAHPHNVYLQIWYELGAVGAALFFMVGALVIRAVTQQNERQEVHSAMFFTLIATMIASSYSLWQLWLVCGIALAVWAYAMARSGESDSNITDYPLPASSQ
jgi:O-antigen ligase